MAEARLAAGPARLGRRLWRVLLVWRDPQAWRLASGLVLFAFALTHFVNHALGHISLEAMEGMQEVRRAVWRSAPGTVLLYGSLALHAALGLWKLVRRRTWRMAPWEAAQIGLGLSIPLLGAAHVAATRGLNATQGVDDTYGVMLRLLWPGLAFSQSLLLAVVWLHAVIGLHQWLRTKTWYAQWSPFLLALAVLVPTVSLTGWIEGARRVAAMPAEAPPLSDGAYEAGGELIERARAGVWTVFILAGAGLLFMRLRDWFSRGPEITYLGGRTVRGAAGATLLEVSRGAGIPHAAICGGRGRCSTCRVLVLDGAETLPKPNQSEAAALARIEAPPRVRLACQIRPEHALTVRPLIPLRNAEPAAGADAYRWGIERRISVMFVDLRGFTTLAERLYPYDSVFLLNRFLERMGEVIEGHGGEVDKFLGDGLMALFGVAPARGSGSRDALLAARDMALALDRLNDEFRATLSEPLRMGIGIHMGPAVLGRLGSGRSAGLTALGDSVNIASRLEGMTKELGALLVASDAVVAASGLELSEAEPREVEIRGREEPLAVHIAFDLGGLVEARPAAAAG